jgi:lipopolysaccharide transport system permease protein
LRDIIANLLTLWFFSSPVIYPMTFTSQNSQWLARVFHKVLYLNPLSYIMDGYHQAIFYGRMPDWWHLLIVFAASLITFILGYFVFDRLRDTFAEEV